MNILVTGGLGFIGLNLCYRLLESGHKVRVIDRQATIIEGCRGLEIIPVDFLKVIDYAPILEGIDVVYHLISTTVPGTSNNDMEFDIISNVGGTLRLLEAMVKMKVKKIVYVSSGGTVYGDQGKKHLTEKSATDPICSYGVQKLTIEKYIQLYYHQYGLDYQIVRLANPYGVGQVGRNGQGIIPIFIHKIKNGEKLQVWGDGSIVRDYIYITDVIEVLLLMLYSDTKEKLFNVGTGVGHSINDIIHIIAKHMDTLPDVEYLPSRGVDVNYNVLDISLADRELKWNPSIKLEDGIKKMIESV